MFRLAQHNHDDDRKEAHLHSCPILADAEVTDAYLNHPDIGIQHPLPIDYATIAQYQNQDPSLRQLPLQKPQHYMLQHFPTENPTHRLIYYRKNNQKP